MQSLTRKSSTHHAYLILILKPVSVDEATALGEHLARKYERLSIGIIMPVTRWLMPTATTRLPELELTADHKTTIRATERFFKDVSRAQIPPEWRQFPTVGPENTRSTLVEALLAVIIEYSFHQSDT